MSSLNIAQIIGNLGRDPELKHNANGDPMCNLSVATSEHWKDKNTGDRRERTEWHRIVIFGPLADVASKHLRKGSKVYLQGQIQTRKWQDQSGQDRYTTEIVLRGYDAKMVMLDGKAQNGDPEQAGMYGAGAASQPEPDVPF